jgi:hypothetical protein
LLTSPSTRKAQAVHKTNINLSNIQSTISCKAQTRHSGFPSFSSTGCDR